MKSKKWAHFRANNNEKMLENLFFFDFKRKFFSILLLNLLKYTKGVNVTNDGLFFAWCTQCAAVIITARCVLGLTICVPAHIVLPMCVCIATYKKVRKLMLN